MSPMGSRWIEPSERENKSYPVMLFRIGKSNLEACRCLVKMNVGSAASRVLLKVVHHSTTNAKVLCLCSLYCATKNHFSLPILIKTHILQLYIRGALSQSSDENPQSYLLRCVQDKYYTLFESQDSARYVAVHLGSERESCAVYGDLNTPRSRLGPRTSLMEVGAVSVHGHRLCKISFLICQKSR